MKAANILITNGLLLNTSRKLSAGLSKSLSTNLLPAVSQLFKDTLLFSGPEMEMMALFLTDHAKTAAAAVRAAALYTRDQLKSKAASRSGAKEFNNFQPCI